MGSVTLTNRQEQTHLFFAFDPETTHSWRWLVKLGRASDSIDRDAPLDEIPRRGRPPRPPMAKTVVPPNAWEEGWRLPDSVKFIAPPVVEMTVEQFEQLFPKGSHQRTCLEKYVSWGDIEVTGLPAGKSLPKPKAEA